MLKLKHSGIISSWILQIGGIALVSLVEIQLELDSIISIPYGLQW